MFVPSDKQATFCRSLACSDALHWLLQGAQGSGKTSIGVRGWASWLAADCPPGQRHICTYADDRQGRVEIAQMLAEWSQETGLRIVLGAKEWRVESLHGAEQRILPMPYGKATADPKFLNWNLASIFVDEAVNMSAGSRKNLISRLRAIPHPKAVWCYNPIDDNGFKREVHDPVSEDKVPGRVFVFKLSDNPGLSDGYRAMQEANYPDPTDRMRLIEGEWCAASGQVYPGRFNIGDSRSRIAAAPNTDPVYYFAGVDPDDGSGVTHGLLLGMWPHGVHVVDEWRNDQTRNPMDAAERAYAVVAALTGQGRRSVRFWVVDANGREFIPELVEAAAGKVTTSDIRIGVNAGVKHLQRFFNHDWLRVDPRCVELIREGESYRWPDNVETVYGDSKPDKASGGGAHGLDGLRYALEKIPPLERAPRRPVVVSVA